MTSRTALWGDLPKVESLEPAFLQLAPGSTQIGADFRF
jgi:hypothetical protein